jgi:DMSO reductase anchor subunit
VGKKVYYEETIKTLRLHYTKLMQLGVLLLLGIFAFSKLYQEHTDSIILGIVVGLLIAFVINIYFLIKNDKKIKEMYDQLLVHLKES